MGSKRRGGTRRPRESQGNAIPLRRSAGVSFPRVGLTINAGQPKHASGVADLDPGAYKLEFAEACHSTHVNCMGDGDAYTPTPDQHRERARLLRSQAESMSPEGKRLFLNIADEFDQLADSIDPARFN